jgi:hypothetical protein
MSSRKQFCSLKAVSIIKGFVALVTQNAVRMRRIMLSGLPRSAVFFHIISQTTQFSKKKTCWA